MSATHAFVAVDEDLDLLTSWFENTGVPFHRHDQPGHLVIHFHEMGPLMEMASGKIDTEQSPIIWIQKPKQIRRSLWTSGEVIFSPTPLREKFPEMERINRKLAKWFRDFPLVYAQRKQEIQYEWAYYLERAPLRTSRVPSLPCQRHTNAFEAVSISFTIATETSY